MKKEKKKDEGVCCDENKLTCDSCSFEDSIKIEEENEPPKDKRSN